MEATNANSRPKSIDALVRELGTAASEVRAAATDLISKKGNFSQIVHNSEWHMRGAHYHFSQLANSYDEFAAGAALRVHSIAEKGSDVDVIIMYAPEFQRMMFDFYALVNIVRIFLDNLRIYLQPVFLTKLGQMPKSILDILNGYTDCPVYKTLNSRPDMRYLCDLRNCIVHYRSLATSDNLIVTKEGLSAEDKDMLFNKADPTGRLSSMARAVFRKDDNNAYVVNVFVPDRIFDDANKGTKKLVNFTYEAKWNILSASRDFVNFIRYPLLITYQLLGSVGTPAFQWKKVKRKRKTGSHHNY